MMSKLLLKVLFLSSVIFFLFPAVKIAASFSGAVYTTDSVCSGVDLNIYSDKEDVYLNGGPSHGGAGGLPDGQYYVQVTEPDGSLLGTSVDSSDETPVEVVSGEFVECYQLSEILIKASDQTPGYDDTTNSGGEYKVWVSSQENFDAAFSKTDNFKVESDDGGGGDPDPESGILNVIKFYDANANGTNDDGILINGWKMRIQDGIDYIRFTPVQMILFPDSYTVTEFMPLEPNWTSTTPNPVVVGLEDGETENVEFGNLCTGAGGGHTKGFWSNKNGQSYMSSDDFIMLSSLNLRSEDGSNFDLGNYTSFRTWLVKARAVNMAYMLSAQLAAMELNVFNGFVSGDSLVYAPGTTSSNALGFATIADLMAEANAELGLHGLVLSGSPFRAYQEALKNALDNANNNTGFVQSTPCPFTFAE